MTTPLTEAERRWNYRQAIANTRIEGHVPDAEFLADCEAVIKGEETHDQVLERDIQRALAEDRAARGL
jgi:hypothetical protein